jgi:hypothetical protein
MSSKTFTKQNLVVLCNHNALHKNVQVFFECIPPTKDLLVKLLLLICLSFYYNFLESYFSMVTGDKGNRDNKVWILLHIEFYLFLVDNIKYKVAAGVE